MKVTLLATDSQASVLDELDTATIRARAYTAYGQQALAGSALGFNGQRSEPHGHYLLGNGYRGYSPSLRRFLSADRISPFGRGGLNAYTYCQGDPVNRVDPNGAFSLAILGALESVLGITLSGGSALSFYGAVSLASGVVGVGAAVSAGVAADSDVARVLSLASLGAGAGSLVAGGGSVLGRRVPMNAKPSRAGSNRSSLGVKRPRVTEPSHAAPILGPSSERSSEVGRSDSWSSRGSIGSVSVSSTSPGSIIGGEVRSVHSDIQLGNLPGGHYYSTDQITAWTNPGARGPVELLTMRLRALRISDDAPEPQTLRGLKRKRS